MQKIYGTSRYLCLQVRFPGKNLVFYIGRGHGYEGFWVGDEVPVSFIRKKDQWVEWSRKNLTSSLLIGISMDPIDRGIRLEFQKIGGKEFLYVSWIGRNAYFAQYKVENRDWFLSWTERREGEDGFEIMNEVGRREIKDTGDSAENSISIKTLLESEVKDAKAKGSPNKKIKTIENKIKKIGNDLEKIMNWKNLQSYVVNDFSEDEFEKNEKITVNRISYKFPRNLTAWQKRDWIFDQVKRLKKAEALQRKRQEESLQEIEELKNKTDKIINTLHVSGPVWSSKKSAFIAPKKEDNFIIHSFDKFKIAVGASAVGNDEMRKLWSKGNDWWVHAANGKSAHAIIKLATDSVPTLEVITQAAKLIANQSRITATQIEIIMTQVKYVRGVTGAAGMVTYKKQKTLLCDLSAGEIE
ncbi:MAG: hypothetical protein K2P81_04825 [Bacteriovoracaceae bacterium]|nr:hypothetical protein [Bacteriovoracaceae bacterium]